MAEVCERSGYRQKTVKKRRITAYNAIPLRKFVWLLDRYNALNGYELSYGQAVQAIADGRIDLRQFKKGAHI